MRRTRLVLLWVGGLLYVISWLLAPPGKFAQSGGTCGTGSPCVGCGVPTSSQKLPPDIRNPYTVCTDGSVSNLNNPNLQSGTNHMVNVWNDTLSGIGVSFETGTSGCEITVRAQALSGDGTWQFNPTMTGGTIRINSSTAASWSLDHAKSVLTHELGHSLGLGDVSCLTGSPCSSTETVMCSPVPAGSTVTCSPTACDSTAVAAQYGTPDEPSDGGGSPHTPILVAVGVSSDYQLTSPATGVWFDIDADGVSERVAWTRPGDPVGFLALDRNRNGVIDNSRELFGNYTPTEGDQTTANGFEALAYWDRPEAGGNGDGWIDNQDALWPDLLVWIDGSHDGFTQPAELFHPEVFQITAISLDYRSEARRDQHGNLYRLKSQFLIGSSVRWGYDVFLATQEP